MAKQQTTANTAHVDIESLELTLASLDLAQPAETDALLDGEIIEGEDVVEEIEAADVVEETTEMTTDANSVVDDDVLQDLQLDEARAEAYAEQTGGPAIETTKKPEPTAQTAKTSRKAKVPTGTATAKSSGRIPRDLNTVAAEFFVLNADPASMSDEDKDAAKASTLAIRDGISQVKVIEKFENLITALSAGKSPSTYTKIAFDLLDDKKAVTSADLVGAYKASGLKEGTARSQTGQMMTLFGLAGIATRTGQKLDLRDDSRLAQRMRDLPKAA